MGCILWVFMNRRWLHSIFLTRLVAGQVSSRVYEAPGAPPKICARTFPKSQNRKSPKSQIAEIANRRNRKSPKSSVYEVSGISL